MTLDLALPWYKTKRDLVLGFKSGYGSYLVHYDTLLQNATDIVTKYDGQFITKMQQKFKNMRQVFYYKMRQFYYKMRQLLRNATFMYEIPITFCYSNYIAKFFC